MFWTYRKYKLETFENSMCSEPLDFVDFLSRHRERMINPKRALDSMSAAAWAKKIKLSSVHCSTLDMAKWYQLRPNIFVLSSQCRFTRWNDMTCTVYILYTFKLVWFVQFSWIQDIVSLFSKTEVRRLWVPTDKTIEDNDLMIPNMTTYTTW